MHCCDRCAALNLCLYRHVLAFAPGQRWCWAVDWRSSVDHYVSADLFLYHPPSCPRTSPFITFVTSDGLRWGMLHKASKTTPVSWGNSLLSLLCSGHLWCPGLQTLRDQCHTSLSFLFERKRDTSSVVTLSALAPTCFLYPGLAFLPLWSSFCCVQCSALLNTLPHQFYRLISFAMPAQC